MNALSNLNKESFLSSAKIVSVYQIPVFQFVAIKNKKGLYTIVKSRIVFSNNTNFISEKFIDLGFLIASSCYLSSDSQAFEYINSIANGEYIDFREKYKLKLNPRGLSGYIISHNLAHEDGISQQIKINYMKISGEKFHIILSKKSLDWDLRASHIPYNGLDDLLEDFGLRTFNEDNSNLEVVVHTVCGILQDSIMRDGVARIRVWKRPSVDPLKMRLGYKVISINSPVERKSFSCDTIIWKNDGQNEIGECEIKFHSSSVVQFFLSFDNSLQNYYWVSDPKNSLNIRKNIYEIFDNDMGVLKDFLFSKSKKNYSADDFEKGVSWLCFLLGFSVLHIGSTPRTKDAADVLAFDAIGNLAVIECTTSLIKPEKVSNLLSRANAISQKLLSIHYGNIKVVPILITSLAHDDIKSGLDFSEKHGVLVLSREDIDDAINRTIVPGNPTKLLDDALKQIEVSKEKHNKPESSLGGEV